VTEFLYTVGSYSGARPLQGDKETTSRGAQPKRGIVFSTIVIETMGAIVLNYSLDRHDTLVSRIVSKHPCLHDNHTTFRSDMQTRYGAYGHCI
jgi:hypothetical protein